jgi:hypothetical protein
MSHSAAWLANTLPAPSKTVNAMSKWHGHPAPGMLFSASPLFVTYVSVTLEIRLWLGFFSADQGGFMECVHGTAVSPIPFLCAQKLASKLQCH